MTPRLMEIGSLSCSAVAGISRGAPVANRLGSRSQLRTITQWKKLGRWVPEGAQPSAWLQIELWHYRRLFGLYAKWQTDPIDPDRVVSERLRAEEPHP